MATTQTPSHFTHWLHLLQSACRTIRDRDIFGRESMQPVYDAGIRLVIASLFGSLARDSRNSAAEFIGSFLDDDRHVSLLSEAKKLSRNMNSRRITAEFPGELYAEYLKYTPQIDSRGKVVLIRQGRRRRYGTYYTPGSVVRYIIGNTLSPLARRKTFHDMKEVRICDPAMGTGNFLREAARQLTAVLLRKKGSPGAGDRRDLYRWVVGNALFGIDRDPVAVRIARAYFALYAGVSPREIKHFIVADSLVDTIPDDWRFHAVIGNPPWLTYGLRGVTRIPADLNRLYRSRYSRTAEYKISAYALFMERALAMTRPGGYHAFIVPDSWLSGKYFSKLRTFLLTHATIEKIVLIQKDFWNGLHIGRSVIYVVKNTSPGKKAAPISTSMISEPCQLRLTGEKKVAVSTDRIKKRHLKRIVVYPDKEVRDFVERMEDSGDVIGNHVGFYSGLIGKRGQDSIILRNLRIAGGSCRGQCGRLIESGKNLGKNRFMFTGCAVILDPDLYKSGFDVAKYKNPKLFLNQTGYTLKACYDDGGFFCLNNLHVVYPLHETADLHFYSALLNSRIMNFYYSVMSMEQGRALAQTDIDFLTHLPHGTDRETAAVISSLIAANLKRDVVPHSHDCIEYSYGIPPDVEREIELLFARWYGVEVPDCERFGMRGSYPPTRDFGGS